MYTLVHHKTLTPEKWSLRSRDQQIFMIANEINRLCNGIRNSLSMNDLQETIERTLELLDITAYCQDGSFRKELLRFREIFGEIYLLPESELNDFLPTLEQFYRILLFSNSKTSILVE